MRWRNKLVLVTGGAGFIGMNLVRKLADLGTSIIVLDNLSIGKKENVKNTPCRILQEDVCALTTLSKIEVPDIIFHLGAPSSDVLFREKPVECIYKTVFGFIRLLDFMKTSHVKKCIYATSSSVYGLSPPPQSEKQQPHPSNLYGLSKLICERITEFFPEIKTVGLRTFAGYGPGEDHKGRIASIVTIFLKQILSGQQLVVFGDGSQSRDFVYIDNIVDAFIKAAERDLEGIINVGTGRPHTFNQLIELLEEKLQRKASLSYAPKPMGYFNSTEADITLMKEKLDIEPIYLEKGIDLYLSTIEIGKISKRMSNDVIKKG